MNLLAFEHGKQAINALERANANLRNYMKQEFPGCKALSVEFHRPTEDQASL